MGACCCILCSSVNSRFITTQLSIINKWAELYSQNSQEYNYITNEAPGPAVPPRSADAAVVGYNTSHDYLTIIGDDPVLLSPQNETANIDKEARHLTHGCFT